MTNNAEGGCKDNKIIINQVKIIKENAQNQKVKNQWKCNYATTNITITSYNINPQLYKKRLNIHHKIIHKNQVQLILEIRD